VLFFLRSIFRKNKRQKEDRLTAFLNEADDALILAHEKRNVIFFEQYSEPKLVNWLTDSIVENDKLFGLAAYRVRDWTVEERLSDDSVRIKKFMTHEHIKLTKDISMSIGDDICELWTVVGISTGAYKVRKIERRSA